VRRPVITGPVTIDKLIKDNQSGRGHNPKWAKNRTGPDLKGAEPEVASEITL
jgi:hypothetical protein